MSCRHHINNNGKDLVKRANVAIEIWKKGIKNCNTCRKQYPSLFACLDIQCHYCGCGSEYQNHILRHAQENGHYVCCSLKDSMIVCLKCNKKIPMERNFTWNSMAGNDGMRGRKIPILLEEMDDIIGDFKPKGLCGLSNMGNTCYMNSALQSLSNCPPLTQFFLKCEQFIQMSDRSKTNVSAEYCLLIKKIWDSERQKFYTPSSLSRSFRNVYPQFRGYNQQDSQEFLRCLMDRLHEELKRPVMTLKTNRISPDCREIHHNHHGKKLLGGNNVQENPNRNTRIDQSGHSKHENEIEENEKMDHENKKEEKEVTTYHSIITDVFNGKLTSSVQCLACQRVSTKIENFQDLSLPIPEKDDLARIHSHGSPHSLTLSSDVQPRGWIFSFYDWLRSWFIGPQVSLQDCLAAFFAKDELKGDNMYNCEKCNKLRNGVKYLRVQTLPEVLCIHLKRFRHEMYYSSKISNYVMFPVNGLELKHFLSRDCQSEFTTYDLCAVITHFGSVGGGHYVSYARNCINNKWYEFNDSQVSEVSEYEVENAEAYCLFYNKRSSKEQTFRALILEKMQAYKSLNVSDGVYISQEWFTRFETCAEPGQISNFDFLCRHGDIHLSLMPNIRGFVTLIPREVWQLLKSRFGGGPEVNTLQECQICKELQKRREYESVTFTKLHEEFQNDASPELAYCLSIKWYNRWNLFTKDEEQEPPGPIDNSDISEESENKFTLKEDSDYGLISESTWKFLVSQYSGGPELRIEKNSQSTNQNENSEQQG